MGLSQTIIEGYANENRRLAPRYQVRDKVWLSTKNIKTKRLSRKLDYKQVGPFTVLQQFVLRQYASLGFQAAAGRSSDGEP